MRRLSAFLAAALLVGLLGGCAGGNFRQETKYTATFLDLFDTHTTVTGYFSGKDAFNAQAERIYDELLEYHRLFDIYHDYQGMHNLKTVNDNAGIGPVTVDSRIIALLQDCKAYYELTGGKVNAAMGSVLAVWHEARNAGLENPENAALPDPAALVEASFHTDFQTVIIDEAASTVFITDPETRLDVGAVAKGWSVQRVAESSPEGLLISVGGNVCATGPKDAAGTPWVVGVQDPDGGDYLHTLYLTRGSMVTSGDYQRCYEVAGRSYHHIIDPETRYPAENWRSVTIVCQDSGLADALSTALFLMSMEEGQALLDACGAQAMWVDGQGNLYLSPGFEELIRT